MRIAIYSSVLYGSDFIVESIRSILPHVDLVYVVLMTRPWGGTSGVTYNGEWVPWPDKFDDTREKLAAMNEPRVKVVITYKDSPWNRWGYALDLVQTLCPGITEIVFLDPDCVFRDEDADMIFDDWAAHPDFQWASVPQIELWRTPAWQIKRPRMMASLHRGDLSLISDEKRKQLGVKVPLSHTLAGRVHNFGFCCSPRNTRWKHLCSMAFSPVIGESIPNPRWYEVKWLNWKPGIGDLEPSIRCESSIREAVPYNIDKLPASIKKRYDAGEWPVFS